MALTGYTPKRKEIPPPVDSIEIYHARSLDIPTTKGHIKVTSHLLTAISLITDKPNTVDGSKSRSKLRHHKKENSPSGNLDGAQFRIWRGKNSNVSERQKADVSSAVRPKINKSLKINRARSLTPNHFSSGKAKTMKRSATCSGRIKQASENVKKIEDYRNAKMNNSETNTCFSIIIIVILLLVFIMLLLWILSFKGHSNNLPYNHDELLLNLTGFEKYLHKNFVNQIFTVKLIQEILKKELNGAKHEQPLVVSFHGRPGVGKTFLAEATAKHLFLNGLDSPCLHNFISSLHISDGLDTINHDIIDWFLQQSYERCPVELFIVDNMEVLTPQLVRYLLINLQKSLSGSNKVKSLILILTSTIGKDLIKDCSENTCYFKTNLALKQNLQSWMESDSKSSITTFDSSKMLAFFPLKRKHVKLCAEQILRQHLTLDEVTDEVLERVASELTFTDFGTGIDYSVSGCKQVAEKAILYL